jgi:hypothetical protein
MIGSTCGAGGRPHMSLAPGIPDSPAITKVPRSRLRDIVAQNRMPFEPHSLCRDEPSPFDLTI